MIRDPAAYKESLMTIKDKWGESAIQPDEAKQVLGSAAALDSNKVIVAAAENENSNEAEAGSKAPHEHKNLLKIVSQF